MKGTYVLVTMLTKDSKIKIGKLDTFNFKRGHYCYVGSALGKAVNLENRIKRHKKKVRKGRLISGGISITFL